MLSYVVHSKSYASIIKDIQIVIEDIKASKIKFSAKNLYFLERWEFHGPNSEAGICLAICLSKRHFWGWHAYKVNAYKKKCNAFPLMHLRLCAGLVPSRVPSCHAGRDPGQVFSKAFLTTKFLQNCFYKSCLRIFFFKRIQFWVKCMSIFNETELYLNTAP